jgi:uncharacterized membrane protein YkvA (DUF1232 family)
MKQTEPRGFHSAQKEAELIINDMARVADLLECALEKANRNKGPLEQIWGDLTTLFRLVKSWINGSYRKIHWQTIVLAIAAIIYFVDPFDLIPDFIPVIGYLDDAVVVGWLVMSIRADINRFLEWEIATEENI